MKRIRRRLLLAVSIPLVLVALPAGAWADPLPPVSPTPTSPTAGFVSTRTATVVTELTAQEISVGSSGTLQVSGRLVEGDTLNFPLSQMAVAVRTSGSRDRAQSCNTVTSRQGRFNCTFHVTAGDTTSVTVIFRGNTLFAPGSATTSVNGAVQDLSPSPMAASPSAPSPSTATGTPADSVTPTLPSPATTPTPSPAPSATAAASPSTTPDILLPPS